MSISEQLTQVNTEKQALKTAFTNLGFDMSSVPFTDYHTLLAELVKGGSTTLTSTISSTSVHFGATLTITGTLKDENSTVLTGETITLKDGDNTLNTTTTNSSGAYSFTYTVSSMTSPNLNVAFKSKGFYLSSTSTIPTITVSKADTVLTLTSDKTSASTGETVTLTATLVDVNGNPVNGATVVFMEGSSTLYSGITDSAGKVNYSYSSSSNKSLKALFNGNVNYNSSVSSNITINNYLFYDTGATDNSNKYGSIINAYNSSGASLSYLDSTNGYKLSANYGASLLKVTEPVSYNIKITAVLNPINSGQFGLGVYKSSGNLYMFRAGTSGDNRGRYVSGGEQYITGTSWSSSSSNGWIKAECWIKNNVWGYTIWDYYTGNQLYTFSEEVTSEFQNTNMGVGIVTSWNSGEYGYFKTVRAELI